MTFRSIVSRTLFAAILVIFSVESNSSAGGPVCDKATSICQKSGKALAVGASGAVLTTGMLLCFAPTTVVSILGLTGVAAYMFKDQLQDYFYGSSKPKNPPAPSHLGVGATVSDPRLLELHSRVYRGSLKYREMLIAIEKKLGRPVKIMTRAEALQMASSLVPPDQVSISQIQKMPFRAGWFNRLGAVIFMDPDTASDADAGSTVVFEITNAVQQERFEQVQKEALEGTFDTLGETEEIKKETGSQKYAEMMEKIEADGMVMHQEIIQQAVSSGSIDPTWDWHGGIRLLPHRSIAENTHGTQYGQDHMAYYRRYYEETVFPLIRKSKQQSISERLLKQRLEREGRLKKTGNS